MNLNDAITMEKEKMSTSKKAMADYENKLSAGCSVFEAEMYTQSYSDALNAYRMHRYALQLLKDIQKDLKK